MRAFVGHSERPRDALVREPAAASHDAFEERVIANLALGIEKDLDTHTKSVLVGNQRCEVGRECPRQHGNRAIGEIDRAPTLKCSLIERGKGSHVVGDIRDTDHNVEPVVRSLTENRVIVVACVVGVDRDEVEPANIAASLLIALRNFRPVRLRLCNGLRRMLFDDAFADLGLHDLDRRHALHAQHVEDLCGAKVIVRLRKATELRLDGEPDHLLIGLLSNHKDGSADPDIVRRDNELALNLFERARDLGVPARNHLDNFALSSFRRTLNAQLDAVTVKGGAACSRGNEYIAFTIHGGNESEAFCGHREYAGGGRTRSVPVATIAAFPATSSTPWWGSLDSGCRLWGRLLSDSKTATGKLRDLTGFAERFERIEQSVLFGFRVFKPHAKLHPVEAAAMFL